VKFDHNYADDLVRMDTKCSSASAHVQPTEFKKNKLLFSFLAPRLSQRPACRHLHRLKIVFPSDKSPNTIRIPGEEREGKSGRDHHALSLVRMDTKCRCSERDSSIIIFPEKGQNYIGFTNPHLLDGTVSLIEFGTRKYKYRIWCLEYDVRLKRLLFYR